MDAHSHSILDREAKLDSRFPRSILKYLRHSHRDNLAVQLFFDNQRSPLLRKIDCFRIDLDGGFFVGVPWRTMFLTLEKRWETWSNLAKFDMNSSN